MNTRTSLRRRSRANRAALGARARREASRAICRHVRTSAAYRAARHIAFFWPLAEEVDLRELLGEALRRGKRCYLPVMRDDGRLWFVRYHAGSTLAANRHRIEEPRRRARNTLPPRLLSLVLVPLLGFDRHGNRLGSGGGYYDRTFSFRRADRGGAPRLLGVAFACQEIDAIPADAWDVPLDWVATENELIRCAR